jgi:hypothetical protein
VEIKEFLEKKPTSGVEWIGPVQKATYKDFNYQIKVKIDLQSVNVVYFMHDVECKNEKVITKLWLCNTVG